MKHYQCKKNNPYRLPHNLYMRIIYLIRDYSRLQEERMNIILAGGVPDGQPKAKGQGRPTEQKAIRITKINDQCAAVEGALQSIPREYRRGVMENVRDNMRFPFDASYGTYKYWRQRFIYRVAERMGEI